MSVSTSDTEKLDAILETYMNGNPDDMRDAIKVYGVKKFFYDILGHMMDQCDETAGKQFLRYRRMYGIYYGFRR